jgi:YHS domain-containing protein
MKLQIKLLPLIFALLLPLSSIGLANEGHSHGAAVPGGMICPVSGDAAKADKTLEYQGKTYQFCCNACMKKFKKNPEKYLKQ